MTIFEHLITRLSCPCCGLTTRSLCAACRDEVVPWLPGGCLRCGVERSDECFCDALPAAVSGIRSVWAFDGPVADILEGAKYGAQLWRIESMKRELGSSLAGCAPRPMGRRWFVPVAPSPRRFRKRGYDIALMLARWAARADGSRRRPLGLRRRGGRPAQASLDREARFEAVKGAFSARGRFGGAHVVLVDDVITTGATVTHAARALADAGAWRIDVVSLARTPRKRPGPIDPRGV